MLIRNFYDYFTTDTRIREATSSVTLINSNNLLLDEKFRKFCTSLNHGLLQNHQLEN